MVHPVDGRSNNSRLLSPTPDEIAKLASLARRLPLEAISPAEPPVFQRSLRRRLSPRAIDDLVARYTAGEQTPALGQEFGISESGVRDLLRSEGVTLRSHAMTVEEAERALHLYARGLTIRQVAALLGYSYSAIWKLLRKHGPAGKPSGQKNRKGSDE
jgi:transposase